MKKLNNVTLVAVDCMNPLSAIGAMLFSMRRIAYHKAVLYTSGEFKLEIPGIEVRLVDPPVRSFREYNSFMVNNLEFETDFAQIVQWDGFVLNENAWSDEFLKYDYVGAVWPHHMHRENFVGNGGFSLRSKKLVETAKTLAKSINYNGETAEDMFICLMCYKFLKSQGIRFAPPDVASKYSAELTPYDGQFGFHGTVHMSRFPKELLAERAGLTTARYRGVLQLPLQ